MARPKAKTDAVSRVLQSLDLNENEAGLYTQMLTHPGSTVQELATRSPLPRTMLYYVLKGLMERGLVSARKDTWRTAYVAEDPERLYDLLAHKEREFEKERIAVRELVPKLKNKYRLAGKRTTIRSFEGVSEYQKALEDIIVSAPKELYAYETLSKKKAAWEVRDTHDRRRVSHKIMKYTLFFEESEALKALKERRYDDFTQFRSITDAPTFETDLMLYDRKLLYTSYYDDHEPTALLIEDRALYEMQKAFFDLLWRNGKDRTLAYTEKS